MVSAPIRPSATALPDPFAGLAPDDRATIEAALRGLRFGRITIEMHEGQVHQVEVTHKIRRPK